MKPEFREAFEEVYEILNLIPKELFNKIPSSFYKMIEDERDKNYHPDIREPIEKCKLKKETILLLGLIYRDFFCPVEERKKLQEKDSVELAAAKIELENELREKYNPDNIFRKEEKSEAEKNETSEETNIAILQEEKWYKKILSIIKKLFTKKKLQ